jgi:hypothetical protein
VDLLPPKIVRRVVLAPFAFLLSVALVVISPVAFLVAGVVDVFMRGHWRTVRMVTFCGAYLVFEALGLAALFALWVRSGFGATMRSDRMRDAHYGFMRWWLDSIRRVAAALFHMRIQIEDRPDPQPGPVLVFSRHAGPGNSLMLVDTLLAGYQRHPRIVMLSKLQWDPLFDTMGNRLPNRFIRHDPNDRDALLRAIGELAGGLGDHDAFVLFPEGHDFTERIRLGAIAHLRKKGHHEHAARAERMARVLPPRHGGVLAAIHAAPQADVVFVAHTVLEDLGSLGDLWRAVPLERPILARYWRVPPAQVPKEQAELIDWLYEWWATIDGWIAGHAAEVQTLIQP